MKILQISTYDIRGGAARATYRLQCALRGMNQDSRMLVRYQETDDGFVSAVGQDQETERNDDAFFLEVPVQERYINSNRTDISNTLFSLPYPGYDISRLSLVLDADIINLHWISQFQSPMTLKHIFALGKPVVWTLHDQWAFTGGAIIPVVARDTEANAKNVHSLQMIHFLCLKPSYKTKRTFSKTQTSPLLRQADGWAVVPGRAVSLNP